MRILVLTNYWPPEIGASSHLTFELCASLVQYGHQVTVVTGFPRYNVLPSAAKPRGGLYSREEMEGIRVVRIAAPSSSSRVSSVRSAEHLLVALPLFLAGLFGGAADLIYTVSPPLPLGVSAHLLAKLKRARFVFGIQDIFPQNAIDLGLLRSPLAIRLARRMETFVYARADRITVHSDGNRDFLLAHSDVPTGKVEVIPNWVDTDAILPGSETDGLRAQYGLQGRFVVLFAGTMGWSQGLDVAVEAANLLRSHTDMVFLMVGDGAEKGRLVAKCGDLGLTNVRHLPMQSWDNYGRVLHAADVCLVTLHPQVKTPVVPSKLLTIMASGRPVVASVDPGGDAPKIIHAARCGYAVQAGDAQALAGALLTLHDDPALREEFGGNGRRYAVEHFSRQACTKAFERLFAQICDRRE